MLVRRHFFVVALAGSFLLLTQFGPSSFPLSVDEQLPAESHKTQANTTRSNYPPKATRPSNKPTTKRPKPRGKADVLTLVRGRGWQRETERKRALDLLRRTDEMLSSVGRDYLLTDGSLLGYCRHAGGFTPWDDDMDILTSHANMKWLDSPEGLKTIADHGLKFISQPRRYGSGVFHKVCPFLSVHAREHLCPTKCVWWDFQLYLAGEDIPKAGNGSWGYPFLDVIPYRLNKATGKIKVPGAKPRRHDLYLPPRRVPFNPAIPKGVLIPNRPGLLLDRLFPKWRTSCSLNGYNHRLGKSVTPFKVACKKLVRLLGLQLAPPELCTPPAGNSSSSEQVGGLQNQKGTEAGGGIADEDDGQQQQPA